MGLDARSATAQALHRLRADSDPRFRTIPHYELMKVDTQVEKLERSRAELTAAPPGPSLTPLYHPGNPRKPRPTRPSLPEGGMGWGGGGGGGGWVGGGGLGRRASGWSPTRGLRPVRCPVCITTAACAI